MAFMTQAKKGMSAEQLQAHLGLKSYTDRIGTSAIASARRWLESGGAGLMGIVEVDSREVDNGKRPWDTIVGHGGARRRVRTQKIPRPATGLVGMVKNCTTATVMTMNGGL